MNKEYDIEFNKEIERILKEVYYNPLEISNSGAKRAIIITEVRFINYLEEHSLIKKLNGHGGDKWSVHLERKGFEVFEKYNGWKDYKKKVINKAEAIENAKGLATRYWWLPIAISLIALSVAILSYFND